MAASFSNLKSVYFVRAFSPMTEKESAFDCFQDLKLQAIHVFGMLGSWMAEVSLVFVAF